MNDRLHCPHLPYCCRIKRATRCGNGVGAPANDTTALRTVAAICLPTLDVLPPFLVTRHPLEVCPLSRRANLEPLSTRLQGGYSLPPASYTRCSVGSPHGSLSRADVHPPGGRRAYHVPLKYLRGLGLAYLPMVQRLCQMSKKHLYLTMYLLVQACQHLWLVGD